MRALILVDIQNDFLPGGALAVGDGDLIVDVANRMAKVFPLVVATQDWHPAGHESFASQHEGRTPGEVIDLHGLTQVLWPDHCVQGTPGAAFADGLDLSKVVKVFPKGTDPKVDSYSGFFDNGKRGDTGLHDYLTAQGVTDTYVLGLATDYCVKFTALDSAQLGYQTHLVRDGCRAVNLDAEDETKAIEEMKRAGVEIVDSAHLE